MSKITQMMSSVTGGGRSDARRSSLWTTPVAWRDAEDCYIGHNGDVWLYRVFPQVPLEWEDAPTRLSVAGPLDSALHEISALSKDLGNGMAMFAKQREFHLISIAWDETATVPDGTPDALAEYIGECLDYTVPTRALFLGVKLASSVTAALDKKSTGMRSLLESVTESLTATLGESVPDMDLYEQDRRRIDKIITKKHGRRLDREQRRQLESWFNNGNGPDVEIYRTRDTLIVDREEQIEFAAVQSFDAEVLHAPDAQWALEAFTHPQGTSVVSIRGRLQPTKVARSRIRRSRRKLRAQQEEEAATSDIDKPEFQEAARKAEQIEQWVLESGEPLVVDCSIIFGRRVRSGDATETFVDELSDRYGMNIKPLVHRQLEALDETLPCSDKRVGQPFTQDLSISMLSYAGLQGFTRLGDTTGVYNGLGDPDWTPVYTNPMGAPLNHLPAAAAVLGDSGSGKTYLLQHLTTQMALAGQRVVFINPKPFDDLSPTVEALKERGVPGAVVHLSRLEQMGGFFDPFRFVSKPKGLPEEEARRAMAEAAAEIATSHITSVMTELTQNQQLAIAYGIKVGAVAGARCVAEALEHVADRDLAELVLQTAKSYTQFGLGIGLKPQERLDAQDGFTLIQFDRKLDLPEESTADQGSYTTSQRLALAALRLITTASLEMLIGGGGGALVVDEAHHYLGSAQGRKQLQSLGREGRSQGLLPILATQRISDLVGHDLESYISRWWVGKLKERKEAEAALRLCGLEPTEARIRWIGQCGPKRNDDGSFQPSMFVHKDLKDRHAAVMVGPTPAWAHVAFSTSPEDRERRDGQAAEGAAASDPQPASGLAEAPPPTPRWDIENAPQAPTWNDVVTPAAEPADERGTPDGWMTVDDAPSNRQLREDFQQSDGSDT